MSDPRITLARPDLADTRLEGAIPAERYVEPRRMQARSPTVSIRKAPDALAEQWDQLLFGETFQAVEVKDGWAWGQAERDGYVGWVALDGLSETVTTPTHWVSTLRTYGFAEPAIRAPITGLFSMNALVTVEEGGDNPWVKVAGVGYIARRHLAPIGADLATDPAAAAERFLGAPYQWGGRESLGLDCSGLIQQALYACGRACPRDSDMQQALGTPLDIGADLKGLQRNDLVFWKGHVGIMLDEARLLHANAHHMAVAIEPLAEAVPRIIALSYGPPVAFRRL